MHNDYPIVSIIVVTYNSADFVLETLESAKNQTYKNIELIITDDCSKDNTVDICRQWIDNNKDRFTRSELVTTNVNTGISANCNRGLERANGEWIKSIAGDDILTDNCINDFVAFCKANPQCKIVFGKMYMLQDSQLTEMPVPKILSVGLKQQRKLVYKGSGLQAPALFISKQLLNEFNGYDTRYKFLEDLPLWIKVTQKSELFHFLDKFVVKYRVHGNNICLPGNSRFINLLFYKDNRKIILNEILPYLLKTLNILEFLNYINYIIVVESIILLGNKNNGLTKIIYLFNFRATMMKIIKYFK